MSSLFRNRIVPQKALVAVAGGGRSTRAPSLLAAPRSCTAFSTTTSQETYHQQLIHQQVPTATTAATAAPFIVPPVTQAQLNAVRFQAAIPMIGFGFMDQTIMIHAGNAIDCTIGVTLGISTLAAAAVGQVVANAGGILFGQQLERFFTRFLPQNHLTNAYSLTATQHSLAVVEKARLSGTFWGVVAGCLLGLGNLLFIDTQWTNEQKQQQQQQLVVTNDPSSYSFEVQVSNQHSLSAKHQPATTLTIRGPDVDGMLAIVLTTLKEEGYSVLEMSAKPTSSSVVNNSIVKKIGGGGGGGEVVPTLAPARVSPRLIEDVFVVRRKGEAIPEEELASLTQRLLKEKLTLLQPQNHTTKH